MHKNIALRLPKAKRVGSGGFHPFLGGWASSASLLIAWNLSGLTFAATLPGMDVLNQLGQFNQNFLLANCLWGAVASGYLIYGWRQRSLIPFLGGFVMMGVSWFTPALTMSAVSIAIMCAVWWLVKQGY
jgi:hypothetical protein